MINYNENKNENEKWFTEIRHNWITQIIFFQFRFTPGKAEQPLRGMDLQEKQAQKDQSTQEICLEKTYS